MNLTDPVPPAPFVPHALQAGYDRANAEADLQTQLEKADAEAGKWSQKYKDLEARFQLLAQEKAVQQGQHLGYQDRIRKLENEIVGLKKAIILIVGGARQEEDY